MQHLRLLFQGHSIGRTPIVCSIAFLKMVATDVSFGGSFICSLPIPPKSDFLCPLFLSLSNVL